MMTVFLVLGVPLALPYVLIVTFGGSIVRTVYPAYILIAACLVIANRRSHYAAFMLAVFAFAPFLRRVADYQAGFAIFNLILLAPYVGLVPTLPAFMNRAFSGRGQDWPFAAILGCVVYAAFLAMFQMAFVSAIYESMRWLLPIAVCTFIMAQPAEVDTVHCTIIRTLCLIVPVLALYGIYQFMAAPLWDVIWMINIDNSTFGVPEAFKIRVFSMMNSPGSVGVFVSYAMILLFGEGLLFVSAAVSGVPLLALTLLRTAWLSVSVGLLVQFLYADPKRRLTLTAGAAATCVTIGAIIASPALPSDIRNLVTERFATFASVSTDVSTYDRLAVYDAFYNRLADSPWGEGFGANASTVSKDGAKRDLVSIDSGILEPYLIFGVIAGTVFFLAFAFLVKEAWEARKIAGRLGTNFAVLCAAVAILPLGSGEIGEMGLLVWAPFGVLLAKAQQVRSA